MKARGCRTIGRGPGGLPASRRRPRATCWRGAPGPTICSPREKKLRAEISRAEELRLGLEQARPGLEALAGACGLPPLALRPGALARRIAARIDEIAKAQAAVREARARLADAPERIARLKSQLARLAEEDALWRNDWREALARLHLDLEATFDEARQRIALFRALPAEWADDDEKARRVAAIRDDLSSFEQRLDALLALCGRDIPARPAEVAVATLREKLARARAAVRPARARRTRPV